MKRLSIIFAAMALASCSEPVPGVLHGYVESETLYMASQESGVVAELSVQEGDHVKAGDVLFRLSTDRLSYSVEQATAAAAAIEQRAAPSGALDQAVAEAEANFGQTQVNFNRIAKLFSEGYVARARYDNDRAAMDAAEARLDRARAERDAALHERDSALAQVGLARQRLTDLEVRAPDAGVVERVYRRVGEVAGPGDPVIALLPPGNMKIRFFVPEEKLSSVVLGGALYFSCDGCGENLAARISHIAREPQFTPPIIYSLEERAKLVFLVEARPDNPENLRPGLPVDVRLP